MPGAISWRKLVKRFNALGFDGPYSGGKHLFMRRGSLKLRIPNNHGQDISAGLVNEIIRQAGVDKDDWDSA